MKRTERLARATGAAAFVAKQDGPGKLIEVVRGSLKDQKPQHERGESKDE